MANNFEDAKKQVEETQDFMGRIHAILGQHLSNAKAFDEKRKSKWDTRCFEEMQEDANHFVSTMIHIWATQIANQWEDAAAKTQKQGKKNDTLSVTLTHEEWQALAWQCHARHSPVNVKSYDRFGMVLKKLGDQKCPDDLVYVSAANKILAGLQTKNE